MNRRHERLVALHSGLDALLDRFEGAANGELDTEAAWGELQQRFGLWADDRRDAASVSEQEQHLEDECRLLYATLESLTARSLDAVEGELGELRQVRARLRAAAELRSGVPSRAIDVHG